MNNQTDFPYEKLFEPFQIRTVRLRNRIVFPEGRESEIIRCKEDGRCLRRLGLGKPISCLVNRSLPPEHIDIPV